MADKKITEDVKKSTTKKVDNKTNSAKEKSTKNRNSEVEALKLELQQQKDLLLRTAAEFDNFKRRTEKEKLAASEFNSAALLKKLLPIFDNADRASEADKDSADYAKGVEMIVKMLKDAVNELGLVEVGKVGDVFDPNLHEAVMHIEDDNFGENIISQVLQKGYKIGDTVVRPAMVQVAN